MKLFNDAKVSKEAGGAKDKAYSSGQAAPVDPEKFVIRHDSASSRFDSYTERQKSTLGTVSDEKVSLLMN